MQSVRQRQLLLTLKYSTIEACFSVPMLNLTLPSFPFVIAFAVVVLGWQAAAVGLMAALPHLCNFIQPPLTTWLRRHFSLLQIISIGFLGSAMPWGMVAVLPWLEEARQPVFALILGVATLSNSVAAVAWSSAISEVVPPRISGRYFGQRNLVFGFWSLLVVFIAGKVADFGGNTLTTFAWIFAVAGMMRILGFIFLRRMHFPKTVTEKEPLSPDWSEYKEPLRDKNYMRMALFVGLWGLTLNMGLPFHPMFLLNELHLQVGDVVLFTTLAGVGGLVTLRGWGILCDKFGSKPVIHVAALIWGVVGVMAWIFASPRWFYHLYPAYAVMGATTAGFQLAQFHLMLKLSPPKKTPHIATFMAVTSLLTAIGPLLGSLVLRFVPDELGVIAGRRILNYHALFAGSFFACLSLTLLLRRVTEPASGPTTHVWHSMRGMRAFNPLLTITTAAQLLVTPRGLMGMSRRSLHELRRQARTLGDVGEEIVRTGREALGKPQKKSSPPGPDAKK